MGEDPRTARALAISAKVGGLSVGPSKPLLAWASAAATSAWSNTIFCPSLPTLSQSATKLPEILRACPYLRPPISVPEPYWVDCFRSPPGKPPIDRTVAEPPDGPLRPPAPLDLLWSLVLLLLDFVPPLPATMMIHLEIWVKRSNCCPMRKLIAIAALLCGAAGALATPDPPDPEMWCSGGKQIVQSWPDEDGDGIVTVGNGNGIFMSDGVIIPDPAPLSLDEYGGIASFLYQNRVFLPCP